MNNSEDRIKSPQQTIIIQQQESRSNGLGVAGFVLALFGLFLSWIPILGWVLWFLGFVFSFIGLFRSPKGLAIAGFVISCISLIILLLVAFAIVSSFMLV